MSWGTTMLHLQLDRDLKRIAKYFKNPRITLVVRNPDHNDADVVLTDDDLGEAIEAIQKLQLERREGEVSNEY